MSEQQAGADTLPLPRNFASQRLRLHLADWGNETAPPLLLLHGGRDHCRSWDKVAWAFRDDWHVMAVDLRGHGDSAWSPDADYAINSYVLDLVELIEQLALAPVTIVAHSLGGNIAIRYAANFPDKVARLVAIEGLRPPPDVEARRASQTIDERLREWIEERRRLDRREPRHYPTIDEAVARMHAMNQHLSEAQARHLTVHGVRRNEDGSFSWKYDERVRSFSPVDLTDSQLEYLYARITCPTLLVYGRDSWATSPAEDGRLEHFGNARVVMIEDAGHWPHHDQPDVFIAAVAEFLAA